MPLPEQSRKFNRYRREKEMGNLIDYRAEQGVAVIELNDPPANTYTYEMNRELDEAILNARMDDDVHVIVMRGSGEKFFSAGANIKMLSEVTPGFKYYFCLHANETLSRLEQTPKLVIAALNGHTVGGGMEIAMAADLRIAKKGAGKMGLPEVTLGVLPGTGGTQRLSRMLGKTRSIQMMIEGNLMEFEDAEALGLVNYVWDDEEGTSWWDKVMEYARSFVPPAKASRAVGRIKRAVQSGCDLPMESGLAIERELQQHLFQSSDAKEGLGAYVGKRKPEFTGK
jgi:enoyl-CoA hydratase